MSGWTAGELAKIAGGDDLHVSPLRQDGRTYGTPTWIWPVAVDGRLYARAYNGTSSRWYQAAMRQGAGRITAAGMTRKVRFTAASAANEERIDAAYRQKYQGSPYLAAMTGARASAATVEITPAWARPA